MAKKTVAKKEKSKKIRGSLNLKTFLILLVLVLGMGGTILVAGFMLYINGVFSQFFVSTWNQANAEAAVLVQQDYRSKCEEVLSIYDSIPEEERGDGMSPEYQAHFDVVLDDDFRTLQAAQRDLKDRNGPMNSFIVALDLDNCRMIYICDSDPKEKTFCYPGTWEVYPQDELTSLVDGREPRLYERSQGIEQKVQACITNQPKFGLRCTGGSTLYETDRYTIMVCVDEKMDPLKKSSQIFLTQYIILLVIVTLITAFIGMFIMRRRIVRPINRMAKAARDYSENGKYTGNEQFFSDLKINTQDEIENLADTLEDLERDLKDHVENIKTITAEEERINTELNLATRIQASMLPTDFPAFPDREEFDVYAAMNPAREIGGDFYDFFLIDEDHLAIEIADVSGKGVPAALFMTASKILLKLHAEGGISPAQVFEEVNERICDNNKIELFVTVWLGILELSTGRLTAANAGHEYPVLIHADGEVELIHDKHGFVIGGLEGMKYTDYELQLEPGDKIFVYTDGVTEATSSEEELFGTKRMLDTLATAGADADPQRILNCIAEAVDEYVGENEQFDDLTMLCLEYRGALLK